MTSLELSSVDDEISLTKSSNSYVAIFARGQDETGVSARFMSCLTSHGDVVVLLDTGQLLLDSLCCLYFMLDCKPEIALDIIKSFLLTGKLINYEVDYKVMSQFGPFETVKYPFGRKLVVGQVLQRSPTLSSQLLSTLLSALQDYGVAVHGVGHESISGQICTYQSVSLQLSLPSHMQQTHFAWDSAKEMYEELQQICWAHDAEIVLRKDDLKYKPKSKTLVVMGMCETVIEQELIDEMLLLAGMDPKQFQNSAPTPQEVLQKKLTALKGQPRKIETEVLLRVRYTESAFLVCGALKTMGYKLALMTQGFDACAQEVGRQLSFDYVLSNHLEVIDGKLTGGVTGEVVGLDTTHMMDKLRKVDWLQLLRDKEGIRRRDVIVIGDYKHAQFLYESCGCRIHFNAAKHRDLGAALYMMGFKRDDVDQFRALLLDKLPKGTLTVATDRRENQEERIVTKEEQSAEVSDLACSHSDEKDTSNETSESKEAQTDYFKAVVHVYGERKRGDELWRLIKALGMLEGVASLQNIQQANIHKSIFLGITMTWPPGQQDSEAMNWEEMDSQANLQRGAATPSRDLNMSTCSSEGFSVLKELVFVAAILSLKIQFTVYINRRSVHGSVSHRTRTLEGTTADGICDRCSMYNVVLVQHPSISCQVLQAVYQALADRHINLVDIERLNEGQKLRVIQLMLRVSQSIDANELKAVLLNLSAEHGADVALQSDNVMRYCRRLVVFDMDSTLIQQEVIDELARCGGVLNEVSHITHLAMNGQLDFYESLTQRVKLLKGMSSDSLNKVEGILKLTTGAQRLCITLRRLGYRLAVVSGGFTQFARYVKRELGLHHAFANSLEQDQNGVLTGRVAGPVVTPQRKASLMRMLADIDNCSVEQVIAVGDGANDIPMLLQAGMGVAFCAKPRVQEQADFRLNTRDISNLLYLLGIPEQVVSKLENESKIPDD